MTVFDKLREKNKAIAFIVKAQNSVIYPALFALTCVISGVYGKEVYLPCIWILTLSVVFAGLFSDDLKIFTVPAFLIYYAIGLDVTPEYYSTWGVSFSTISPSAIPHFVACGTLLVGVLLFRLIASGYLGEMLRKRGICFVGLLAVGGALVLGGSFSPEWRIVSPLFGLLMAFILIVFYMLFTVILSHSRDGIAYACKTLVCLGYAVTAQIAIIAYRLHLYNNLLVELGDGVYYLNRGLLTMSWGLATIVGATMILPLGAAIYLMRSRRYPILSFVSAVIFWIATMLINTRSATIIGALVLAVGTVMACVGCKNKRINRVTAVSSILAALICAAAVFTVYSRSDPDLIGTILSFLRFKIDPSDPLTILASRKNIWEEAMTDFVSSPVFGTGFVYGAFIPEEASANMFSNMYHNILLQFLGAAGLVGVLAFAIHLKHVAELTLRRFSLDKLSLLLVPLSVIGMSLVDNFFFYPNFMIVYTAFLAAAEIKLEQDRAAALGRVKRHDGSKKPRVVFAYVEAGKGHIVPTDTVYKEFIRKYGDRAEVVQSRFFTETQDRELERTELLFSKAVRMQNRSPVLSVLCKLGNLIAGDCFALFVLLRMTFSGTRAYPRAVAHLKALDADVVYTAHWSIPFYANGIKKCRPYVICFCPDVYSNGAFNTDCNNFLISSAEGYERVSRIRMYAGGNIDLVPFPMRKNATEYRSAAKRAECRAALGISEKDFTVVLSDGGYGMARLEKTVERLLRSKRPLTVIALCGTNHSLYLRLSELSDLCPPHIRLIAVDFTDRVLDYIACADIYAGKSGANSIAEPAALGIPIIVTKCITYIERGIKDHYVRGVKGAMYIPSARRAAKAIEAFAARPSLLAPYTQRLTAYSKGRYDAEASADLIWQRVCELREEKPK